MSKSTEEIAVNSLEEIFDGNNKNDKLSASRLGRIESIIQNLIHETRWKAFDEARETVARFMIEDMDYATGHGDTLKGLLAELKWQVEEEVVESKKQARREAFREAIEIVDDESKDCQWIDEYMTFAHKVVQEMRKRMED